MEGRRTDLLRAATAPTTFTDGALLRRHASAAVRVTVDAPSRNMRGKPKAERHAQ